MGKERPAVRVAESVKGQSTKPASRLGPFLLRIPGSPCRDVPRSANVICYWVHFTQGSTKPCKNWRRTLSFHIKLFYISRREVRLKQGPGSPELRTGWGMIFLASPTLTHSWFEAIFSSTFLSLFARGKWLWCLLIFIYLCTNCRSMMSRPLDTCKNTLYTYESLSEVVPKGQVVPLFVKVYFEVENHHRPAARRLCGKYILQKKP